VANKNYPRTARVAHVLQQVIAEELEEIEDERLDLLTVTGVKVDRDLRRATVFFTSRHEGADEALMEHRVALQAAIGRQTQLRRTPQLAFEPDPAVATGWRIEEVLRDVRGEADES
jgi:ribosome-binding factor A